MIDEDDFGDFGMPDDLLKGIQLDHEALASTTLPLFASATRTEWAAMENAAVLAHLDRHDEAEATRHAAGYHNLPQVDVPSQRHLLTDNDPLD